MENYRPPDEQVVGLSLKQFLEAGLRASQLATAAMHLVLQAEKDRQLRPDPGEPDELPQPPQDGGDHSDEG